MGKKLSLWKKGTRSFTYLALGILILSGCATTGPNEAAPEKATIIESLMVDPSPEKTVVEISNTETTPYTAFKKVDPLGVILDIRGKPGTSLPLKTMVNEGTVREIRFEESETQVMTTRMFIDMAAPFDYQVEAVEKGIRVTLLPEIPSAAVKAPEKAEPEGRTEVLPVTPSEPRLFFKKGPSTLPQILGIDFTMLDQGKSRLIVTADRKVAYNLDPKGPKALVMKVPEATIPPLIMRYMDSTYFEGAVERVKASLVPPNKGVSIVITLREMVPFHVKQVENEISIDFGRTVVSPPEKKIVPLKLAQVQATPGPKVPTPEQPPTVVVPPSAQPPGISPLRKVYTGAPMTMDFVNADVTNILRLIAEISNLNIVWSPDVKGTVSMRLKDVPWDQALDLILDNNNLGMRHVGNVVWITTKAQISQIEAEERRKIEQYEAKLDAERKKVIAEKEKEKELEPMVTEYMRVDFAKADEITPLITLSEAGKARGAKMSVDARTNTIIITDIGSNIAIAKQIVKEFDTPVKQVMIEARIVDATDSFTRDLGIQWDQFQIQKKSTGGVPFTTFGGTPESVSPGDPSGFPAGGRLSSPTFISNVPTGWAPNMGLVFSKLSGSGLTGTILNAKLALSETEGTAKIISAPKVIAMNGQSATISRGDSIIIQATENVASTTLDATLSLTVTPTVSFNNYITLDVQVTDDSAPSTSRLLKKSINTKLMVKTGETVVIGGIYKEDKGDDESGIPALRRIPFLGWLFKAQSKRITKSELLIFLTPTVISAPVKS